MKYVILHYEYVREGRTPLGRLGIGIGWPLVRALRDLRVPVAITRGFDSFVVSDDGIPSAVSALIPPDDKGQQPRPVTLSMNDISVIRDIAGDFRGGGNNPDHEKIIHAISHMVTVLNGPTIRQFDNKWTAYETGIYGRLAIPTIPLRHNVTAEGVLEFFGNPDPHNIIIKPAKGAASRDLYRPSERYSLQEIIDNVLSQDELYIAQIVLDNLMPFPPSIQPENAEQHLLFTEYKNAPKELRIFWFFGTNEELQWMPAVKLTEKFPDVGMRIKTRRFYAFIDRATMPNEIIQATHEILERIHNTAQVDEISGVFDFAYGIMPNETEPAWWLMEGNYWQPVQPTRKRHAGLFQTFVDMTAHQLARAHQHHTNIQIQQGE